jgi:hypothetical protein
MRPVVSVVIMKTANDATDQKSSQILWILEQDRWNNFLEHASCKKVVYWCTMVIHLLYIINQYL